MKLNFDFTTMNTGDAITVVPLSVSKDEFRGYLNVNESTLEVINLLKEETTEAGLIDTLAQKYSDSSKDDITANVKNVIETLRSYELLSE